MCLILVALETHPRYTLVLAANRDEFYERPTAQAAFWDEHPHLLAGRDLRGQGTWLGITLGGRIAAVTNYRDPSSIMEGAPSRGGLITGYLTGDEDPAPHIDRLKPKAHLFNGFNILLGDGRDMYWYSNRGEQEQRLSPGIHGVSNRLLDTPWPKITRGKERFQEILSQGEEVHPEEMFSMLRHGEPARDEDLPDTGVGLELERMLSPLFITSPDYGTRSSTLLLIDRDHRVTFLERTFNSDPQHPMDVRHEFTIK
jgi:uncharacterized protein with NRDE domain